MGAIHNVGLAAAFLTTPLTLGGIVGYQALTAKNITVQDLGDELKELKYADVDKDGVLGVLEIENFVRKEIAKNPSGPLTVNELRRFYDYNGALSFAGLKEVPFLYLYSPEIEMSLKNLRTVGEKYKKLLQEENK